MNPVTIYCATCGAANPTDAAQCFACGNPPLKDALRESTPAPLLRQRYHLLRQVGKGGFGAVYQAEDTQLGNRLVALKEMRQHGLTPEEVREAVEHFHREALLLASLHHPNLPQIYEQFEEGEHWYLVMEYIQGETLEERLSRAPNGLSLEEALKIGLQLSSVLGYLHTRRPPVIFRDLKPSNIMLTRDGQVYLIDFGIARLFKPGQSKDTESFGSAGYAAPEQYGKAQTTAQSDIYGLGATLHHLLSRDDPSNHPFLFKPLRLSASPALEDLIMQMLEQDTTKRPADMRAIGQELQRISDARAAGQQDRPASPAPSSSHLATAARTPLVSPKWAAAQPMRTPSSAAGQGFFRRQKLKLLSIGGLVALCVVAALIFWVLSFHQTIMTSQDIPCIQVSTDAASDPCSSGADSFHVGDTVYLNFIDTNTNLYSIPVKLLLNGAVIQSDAATFAPSIVFTFSMGNGSVTGTPATDKATVTQTGIYTWIVNDDQGDVDASITFQVTS